MKTIFVILFSLIISTAVEAALPAIDIHTPNGSKSAPFRLAKVYFLPDWSESEMEFDGTDEKPCTEICPQKTSYDCASGQTETYTNSCGLTCSRCVECYGCEAKGYTLTNCPANASCLNDCCNNLYKLMNCNDGYALDGSSCRKETCSDNPNICTGGKTCISGSCQCPSGQTDVGGKCETSTCTNNGIKCSGSTGVCNTSTGKCVECLSNSDCGGGKECNADNQCIVPDACAKITCSGGKSCVNGACVCPSNQVDNNGTCEAPNCANGGVTCSAGQTCNQSTGKCETEKEYCVTGSIFYSDASCSSSYDAEKTPIGVVVDPKYHLLVGLQSLSGTITEDTNFGFKNVGNEIPDNQSERGYENTEEIYEQIKNTDKNSVVKFCWKNISPALFGRRWYIPATAEAALLVKNITKVNNTLTMLAQYIDAAPVSGIIWTSDESKIGKTLAMIAYGVNGEIYELLKNATEINTRCIGRYFSDEFWGKTITPSVDGVSGSYTTYPIASCPKFYFKEIFYWNSEYSRCVYDYELEKSSGGTTPSSPSCEEWIEAGWQDAGSTYNANLCRSYNEEIKECQYKDGRKGRFCDLSTNCQVGADAYYTYKYCPNGAQCMYRSCTYYKNLPASGSYLKQIGKKKCFACWGFTNESCGSMSHFVQCK